MSEHEDRQRALAALRALPDEYCSRNDPCPVEREHHAADDLRDCVAIPAAEYDMLRLALWLLMRDAEYDLRGECTHHQAYFESIGFAEAHMRNDKYTDGTPSRSYTECHRWTNKARQFAAEMEGK